MTPSHDVKEQNISEKTPNTTFVLVTEFFINLSIK